MYNKSLLDVLVSYYEIPAFAGILMLQFFLTFF